jgi:short-subunit dehydrogenase
LSKKALIIGNSDGIGLSITRELLKREWEIVGISRSKSPITDPLYKHVISEVQENSYLEKLKSVLRNNKSVGLCIYCAGIGELLDVSQMEKDVLVFEVNLIGMVKTAAHVIPQMVERGGGHFIGLSSVADELLSSEAPSYHASKAGLSNYLEGLALAVKPMGVSITNLRFGFIDTKMAKGDVKPFMMTVAQATRHLLFCIEKRPVRYTAPKIIIPLVKFRRLMLGLKVK